MIELFLAIVLASIITGILFTSFKHFLSWIDNLKAQSEQPVVVLNEPDETHDEIVEISDPWHSKRMADDFINMVENVYDQYQVGGIL